MHLHIAIVLSDVNFTDKKLELSSYWFMFCKSVARHEGEIATDQISALDKSHWKEIETEFVQWG